jgi:hypothetical protein
MSAAQPPLDSQPPPERPDKEPTHLRMTYEEFLAWATEDVHAE